MGSSERQKELRRRRHRRVKIDHLKRKLAAASASEKAIIAEKIRRLTPGSDAILAKLELNDV